VAEIIEEQMATVVDCYRGGARKGSPAARLRYTKLRQ
jgi:hypothetical protein